MSLPVWLVNGPWGPSFCALFLLCMAAVACVSVAGVLLKVAVLMGRIAARLKGV